MGLQPLNGIEEVNIFKDNGEVLHITTPKSKAMMCDIYFQLVGEILD